MARIAAVVTIAVALAACAEAPGPCPVGQARDNAGACVAIATPPQALPPLPPGYKWDNPPSKDEFIAGGITPEAQAQIDAANAKIQARRAADDAEWAANRRTDRLVEAQEDTRRAVEAVADKL